MSPDAPVGRIGAVDAAPVLQARKTLSECGQVDDVALIDRALRSTSGPPIIVVVGEVKRGKSTLVNALAGEHVSPAGADLPTTGVVSVVPPSPNLPAGRAELVLARGIEIVACGEAVERLTPTEDWDRESPLGARFAVASRWVPGAALVDTPGVGGLDSAHARRARLAAADAAALLFVTDGGQPLTAPELAFLREVSAHTEHVVLALTKIDRNPGSWGQIRDENRALLAKHAPRFAGHEIYPVSAAYAVHALSQPDDIAARLEGASGLPALAAALRDLTADRRRLSVANALRAGHSGLERLQARVDLEIRAVTEIAVVRDLEAERARLAELQLQQRRGKLDLERDLGRIRQAAVQYTGERADEALARLSARIRTQKRGMAKSARDQFAAELQAELTVLATEVRTFTGDRLTSLVVAAFGSLDEGPQSSGQVSAQLHEVQPRVRARPNVVMNPMLDPSVAGTAFMGSHIAGLAGLGGPAGLLIGGGAMVALTLAFRGVRQGQQELAGTLHETISGAKQDLIAGIDAWIRELRPELHIALEDYLKASMAAVREILDEAQRAAQQDEAARRKELEGLQRRQQAVATRRTAVAARLLELNSREHSSLAPPPTDITTTDPQTPGPDPRSAQ